MPVGELHRLVHVRLGRWLPRPVLRRVHTASGGNPFFALGMAESLIRRGIPASAEALPVPATIGELVRDRLEPLSARCSGSTAGGLGLASRSGCSGGRGRRGDGQIVEGLSEAEDAGILVRSAAGWSSPTRCWLR